MSERGAQPFPPSATSLMHICLIILGPQVDKTYRGGSAIHLPKGKQNLFIPQRTVACKEIAKAQVKAEVN